MKILAMDIGAGTKDILLYDDSKKSVENCIKMVLPSPSLVYAEKIKEATRLRSDIFLKGYSIGGGSIGSALREHVEKGFRAVMTEDAAYTVRNDLSEVKDLGIEIVNGDNPSGTFKGGILTLDEINIRALQSFLTNIGETCLDLDFVAIAVQDHGVSPRGMSNRKFRIQNLMDRLAEDPKPEALAFMEYEIPSCFRRMNSAAKASKNQLPKAKVLLMDTATDAILGCLKDPVLEDASQILVVNVGNGHTLAALISNGNITGIMEHHTRLLSPQKIEGLLVALANGRLSNEDVFRESGHGVFYLADAPGFSKIEKTVTTGPNRGMLARSNLTVHSASPAGDVMMTGPVGLVEAVNRKLKSE